MTEEEFKKEIYELAFGVGPYKPEPKEVVERIEKYTNDSFLVEDKL